MGLVFPELSPGPKPRLWHREIHILCLRRQNQAHSTFCLDNQDPFTQSQIPFLLPGTGGLPPLLTGDSLSGPLVVLLAPDYRHPLPPPLEGTFILELRKLKIQRRT